MFKFILLFTIHYTLFTLHCNAQCKFNFYQKKPGHYCTNSDTVVLEAWDTTKTGGCLITPGVIINIALDANSSKQDFITIYENGRVLKSYSATLWSPFPLTLLSNEWNTNSVYSFKFCVKTKNGTFPYTVYDRNHMKLIASGTILGSDSCTTIVLPKLTGIARFSGPGVKNYNNGYGMFDPAVAGPGIHKIQYYWNDGMGFADSVSQTDTVNPTPVITLNPIQICPNSNGTLTAFAKGARTYLWSTNENKQSIIVPAKDSTYIVTIKDSNDCLASKSATVNVLPYPVNFLKHDTTLCNVNSLVLKPAQTFHSYLWQDGSVKNSIIVNAQGVYKLTVTDNAGCIGDDSIKVVNECPPAIFLPTAFTPDDLNINNVFYAYGANITNYRIDIYNKWGFLVFHSENINTGWNGKYNNNLCPTGVYLYVIHFEGLVNGKTEANIKRGTFALLR